MNVPAGFKSHLGKGLGAGLCLGAIGSAIISIVNAGNFEALVPGLKDKAFFESLITCAISAPLGWALWAGFILKG